jgi:hypothetical protein
VLCADPKIIEPKYMHYNSKPGPVVHPGKLHWAPLSVMVKKDKWTIKAKLKATTTEEDL